MVGVPLSSRPPEIAPLRLRLLPTGFKAASFAVVPGIRQLKKSRILSEAGKLDAAQLARLDQAVREYLAD